MITTGLAIVGFLTFAVVLIALAAMRGATATTIFCPRRELMVDVTIDGRCMSRDEGRCVGSFLECERECLIDSEVKAASTQKAAPARTRS